MSATAGIGKKILAIFDEHQLSEDDGWLVCLHLLATTAVKSGMTLKDTLERVERAYRLYQKAYAAMPAAVVEAPTGKPS